jgi:hypothetical protein
MGLVSAAQLAVEAKRLKEESERKRLQVSGWGSWQLAAAACG